MKIEDYKLGQKVSLYGRIEAIDIENMRDIENTTTLKINTLTRTISVNPKWEEVTIEPDQPKPVLKKEHAEWLEELKNEFSDDLPNQLYHVTRQGWGNGLEFKSTREQKIKIIHAAGGKIKKDLVNALIYGYTVQKEKLYVVKVLGCTLFKMTSDNGTEYKLIGENETPPESKINGYKFEVNLTEQDIKKIKQADERLLQFAKEVTE